MTQRRLGPWRALVVVPAALGLVLLWLMVRRKGPAARRLEQAFFRLIAKGCGIRIATSGRPEPLALFIANHISWADIPVLASVLDADFVAKADIGNWPVIGWLARRYDPVFVERDRRSRSGAHAEAVRARLARRRSVILCPEGTTSIGTDILPFRTSLFAAADSARFIQPVVIRYLTDDGRPLSPERQREVAWIDDDELLAGAARLARRRTQVLLDFLEPVEVASHDCRKALARTVHSAMSSAYAAAPNLPR